MQDYFNDPGADVTVVLPFNYAAIVYDGIVKNTIPYADPTHITLKLKRVNAMVGNSIISVTKPDAQTTCLN